MSTHEIAAHLFRAKKALLINALKCFIIVSQLLLLPIVALADGGSWGTSTTYTAPCPAGYSGSGITYICRGSNNGSGCALVNGVPKNPSLFTVQKNNCAYTGPTFVKTETSTQQLTCPSNTPSGSAYQTQTYDIYSDGSTKNYSAWNQVNNCFNKPPTTSNLTMTIAEDTSGTLRLPVSDDGPGPYAYKIVGGPSSGAASVVGDTLTYTPEPDWNGTTSLTFVVIDGANAQSGYATVDITVNAVNDAPVAQNKTLVIDEDTTGNVTLSATDIDSPPPTVFELVNPSPNGTASINGATLTFTPNRDWFGTTTLTYRAQDSAGAWSAPATVTITVNPVNDAPVAQNRTLVIDEDTTGNMTLSATDIDSPPPTTFELVNPSPNGAASINGATLTFTPNRDWFGTTTLTYRAQDSAGAWSAPATVTITVNPVNDAPVAQNRTLVIDEDTTGNVTLSATDIDSPPPTTFELVNPSPNGAASINGATLTFTPNRDWFGTTTLTYRAQDSAGAWSAPATVTITVNPVNDAPVAQSKALVIDEDTTGYVTLSATDIDSPPPTVFELVNPSPNGSASISGATLTFTPNQDWFGTTALTYRAQDSSGAWSVPATVYITVNPVNDPPVVVDRVLNIKEDEPGSITLSATDVENNFPFHYTALSVFPSEAGKVTIADSTLTFIPTRDWNGQAQFKYQATDSDGGVSRPAIITVNVEPVNDTPVLTSTPLTIKTTESTAKTVRAAVMH